jgi:hypothetical protein
MSNAANGKASHEYKPRNPALRVALDLIERVYAAAVIVVVAWLSYRALYYLVITLMFPTPAPPQITGVPTRLTQEVLKTAQSEWVGVQTNENPRAPLAHYHRLEGWIQPDPWNNCTQSGCHAPLPHTQSKELRAFLNAHATSQHCGVCHMETEQTPLPVAWYDLQDGQRSEPPPVLKLYAWMVSDEGRAELANPTTATQNKVVRLLQAGAAAADGARPLQEFARHFAAVRHTSPAFQRLVEEARDALPRHFRGEYGAKLALLQAGTDNVLLGHPDSAAAVAEFRKRAGELSIAQRANLVSRIHNARRETPLHCTDCHSTRKSLIDFAALGYPAERVQQLSQPMIFRMIEHIGAGEPFYLPGFMAPEAQPGEDEDVETP